MHAGDVFAMDDVPVDFGPDRMASPAATPSTSSTPRATATRSSPAATRPTRLPHHHLDRRPADQGIFYIGREMKETFLSALT